MKTLISIPLMLPIIFSGISVKFATHYCGGYVAATKVSLKGELATCGMERQAVNNSFQKTYDKHCCENVVSAYSIGNKYIPSYYCVKDPLQQVISMIYIPVDCNCNQLIILNTSYQNVRPPGSNYPNSVVRPALCIFRI